MVLILILLEYGLRHIAKSKDGREYAGLNPYSTGIWSATLSSYLKDMGNMS